MHKILIAGSGGQGILFLGKVLAESAMLEGKNVTWFPSYGAEMRGGTANCTVVISDGVIGSPIVGTPDILIAMNKASTEKFQGRLAAEGLLILDSSFIDSSSIRADIRVVKIPASEIAASLGSVKAANMVILGAFMKETGLIGNETLISALRELMPAEKALDVNMEAIKRGGLFNAH